MCTQLHMHMSFFYSMYYIINLQIINGSLKPHKAGELYGSCKLSRIITRAEVVGAKTDRTTGLVLIFQRLAHRQA